MHGAHSFFIAQHHIATLTTNPHVKTKWIVFRPLIHLHRHPQKDAAVHLFDRFLPGANYSYRWKSIDWSDREGGAGISSWRDVEAACTVAALEQDLKRFCRAFVPTLYMYRYRGTSLMRNSALL